jgi:hypothetical protein
LVLFVRIGAFQWVTANPNKKIDSASNSPLGLCAKRLKRALLSSSGQAPATRVLDSASENIYNTYFWFCQSNSDPGRDDIPVKK